MFSISPVLSATIYSGEVYNANYECPEWNLPGCAFEKNVPKRRWTLFCDSLPRRPEDNPEQFAEFGRACFDVMELPAPGGVLCSQMMEPIREMRQFKPVSMTRLPDGKYVFDFMRKCGYNGIHITETDRFYGILGQQSGSCPFLRKRWEISLGESWSLRI